MRSWVCNCCCQKKNRIRAAAVSARVIKPFNNEICQSIEAGTNLAYFWLQIKQPGSFCLHSLSQ
jgi:hypothetical protein